ncbi:MAG: hypothetical protein AVDCRST_MAG79-2564 [uncultured Thermoleophilia bacterium]|uniref:Uncharacterized protein n=1 Tax=uncultured Thermoleophilia bacterium TaxID=1497501 RepID=A0A6J4UJ94_9ACTN|nr:MAG: hypothetical protein AVDCRST_MAG79-2564 [uncultured Thermoleophilia bacterium]
MPADLTEELGHVSGPPAASTRSRPWLWWCDDRHHSSLCIGPERADVKTFHQSGTPA